MHRFSNSLYKYNHISILSHPKMMMHFNLQNYIYCGGIFKVWYCFGEVHLILFTYFLLDKYLLNFICIYIFLPQSNFQSKWLSLIVFCSFQEWKNKHKVFSSFFFVYVNCVCHKLDISFRKMCSFSLHLKKIIIRRKKKQPNS